MRRWREPRLHGRALAGVAVALALAALSAGGPSARAQDPFGGLTHDTASGHGTGPPSASPVASPAPPGDPAIARARALWLEATTVASAALEDPDLVRASARLRQALEKYLQLVTLLETKLGLRTKGAPPFYAVGQGIEMADLLYRAYLGTGEVYESIFRRSVAAKKADETAKAGAIQYYWQAAATSFFQMDPGRWERRLFPELFVAPQQSRLEGSMRAASERLHNFLVSLSGKEFQEAKSLTNRTRKGLITALKEQITAGYKDLDTPPEGYLTDIRERLDARKLANLRHHRKQEAAQQIVEAQYKIGLEYLTTARAAATEEDFLLALRHLQAASVQVYWARTKRFRLSETQTRTLVRALLGRIFGAAGLAERLAQDTGLPADQIQAALDRLGEELSKFVVLPGSGGAAAPTAPAAAQGAAGDNPAVTPAVLETMVAMAARGDVRGFARMAKTVGYVKSESDERVLELIAKLKELLYRDTVPYGYWIAVTGTPEIATETYFQVIKERYGVDVKPLASTIAVQNLIRALRQQDYLAGRQDLGIADRLYRQAEQALMAAEQAIARRDQEAAKDQFARAQRALAEVERLSPEVLAAAESTYYVSSFPQLRSRLYLRLGEAYYEQARLSEPGSANARENYRRSIEAYRMAADRYPMRHVEELRARHLRREGGDPRLPGPLVDDTAQVGVPSIHADRHSTHASRKLNSVLEELTLGNDPTFRKSVQEIVRELVTFRGGAGISAENPNLNLFEQFKVAVSKAFGDHGVLLVDPDLTEISRDLLAILYDSTIDEGIRRVRLAERVGQAMNQASGGGIVEDVASTMEEKVSSVLATDESLPQAEREAKARLEDLVKRWERRLDRATPSAGALNALFFRIAETYRSRATMLEGLAAEKERAGDADGAKLKRKEAAEATLNALRFYYMATVRVYYGNDRVLAIQLPEWDMTLYLAYRAQRIVRAEAPAVTQAAAALVEEYRLAPRGAKISFIRTKVRDLGTLIVEGTKAMVADARGRPVTFAAKGIRAAGRGVAGHARTVGGKLLSLGGLAFFVVARYAHNVELPGNRVIVLDDTTIALAADRAFQDLLGNRVLRPRVPP